MRTLPLEITATALAALLSLLVLLLPLSAHGRVAVPRAPDPDVAFVIAQQGDRALLDILDDSRVALRHLPQPALDAYTAISE